MSDDRKGARQLAERGPAGVRVRKERARYSRQADLATRCTGGEPRFNLPHEPLGVRYLNHELPIEPLPHLKPFQVQGDDPLSILEREEIPVVARAKVAFPDVRERDGGPSPAKDPFRELGELGRNPAYRGIRDHELRRGGRKVQESGELHLKTRAFEENLPGHGPSERD